VQRRDFLAAAAAAPLAAAATPIPVIDTHIHLYDPRRPEGIPWPPKTAPMYWPALPDGYRKLTKAHNVVGAIEVECSPWLEDNQWVLDIAAKDTIVVGMIGNLEPSKPDFNKQLDRFAKNPLFRGIRYGNLWDRPGIHAELKKPEFIAGLKRMAAGGLTLDTANPTVELLEDLIQVGDRVPDLKIVIDHLPKIVVPADAKSKAAYTAAVRTLASRPKVFVKVSAVLNKVNGKTVTDLAQYKSKIDFLYDSFGQDRLLYGSDWPNSETVGNYAQVFNIVKTYFDAKGPAVAEKYFWKNSIAAYNWVHREKAQPGK
jgi:predicted TIM-barrel fold metal-dependent hydrolase